MPGSVTGKIEGDASGFLAAVAAAKSALAGLTGGGGGGGGGGDPFAEATKGASAFTDAVTGIALEGHAVKDSMAGIASVAEDTRKAIEGTGEALAQLPEHADSLANLGEQALLLGPAMDSATRSMGGFTSVVQDALPAIRPLQESIAATGDAMALLPERAASLSAPLQAIGDAFGQIVYTPAERAMNDLAASVNDVTGAGIPMSHMVEDASVRYEQLARTVQDTQAGVRAALPPFQVAGDTIGDFGKSVSAASGAVFTADSSFGKFSDTLGNLNMVSRGAAGEGGFFGGLKEKIGGIGEGMGGFLGAVGGGFMETLNAVAMPLMALQMVTQIVGQVGQSIYNAAAIAEGPAAHGFGSFTGAVDAAGAAMAKSGQSAAETFGQQLTPALQGFAQTTAAPNGPLQKVTDFLSYVGGQIASAFIPTGVTDATTAPALTAVQTLAAQQKPGYMGQYGVPGPGTTGVTPGYYQGNQFIPPSMGAWNDQYWQGMPAPFRPTGAFPTSPSGIPGGWGPGGTTSIDQGSSGWNKIGDFFGGLASSIGNLGGGVGKNIGDFFGGIGNTLGGVGHFLESTGAFGLQLPSGGGCFPAGTRILMADGTEQPIETLQPGDQVRSIFGTKLITTGTVTALHHYIDSLSKLSFADGSTLRLTCGHPLMTAQGWKSLAPHVTHVDNPDLEVQQLTRGDRVFTSDLTYVEIVDIEAFPGTTIVYNITVEGDAHTFFADGKLAHNVAKAAGGETTLQAKVNWVVQGAEKTITAIASWIVQNAEKAIQAVASWLVSGAEKAIQAVASWAVSGAEKAIQAVASWAVSGAEKAIQAVASWVVSGAEKAIQAVASWVVTGAEKAIEAVAKWAVSGAEKVIQAVANWIDPPAHTVDLGSLVHFIGGAVGSFASGVENFEGGLAYVHQDELLFLPRGTSVRPAQVGSPASGPTFLSQAALSGPPSSGGGPSGPMQLQVMLDSRVIAEQVIPQVAAMMRVQAGTRR